MFVVARVTVHDILDNAYNFTSQKTVNHDAYMRDTEFLSW